MTCFQNRIGVIGAHGVPVLSLVEVVELEFEYGRVTEDHEFAGVINGDMKREKNAFPNLLGIFILFILIKPIAAVNQQKRRYAVSNHVHILQQKKNAEARSICPVNCLISLSLILQLTAALLFWTAVSS